MATTKTRSMVFPDEAQAQAKAVFKRHAVSWAVREFFASLSVEEDVSLDYDACPCTIALHPPTEKAALQSLNQAREWTAAWREHPLSRYVEWTSKSWPSLGRQEMPARLALSFPNDVAAFSRASRDWEQLRKRVKALSERWTEDWANCCSPISSRVDDAARALKRGMKAAAGLANSDWGMLLSVLDWLIRNPNARLYVRQLPIRGVDTKWIERHRAAVSALYEAMAGEEMPPFRKPPQQFRVRILDPGLAPGGLRDLSVVPEELNVHPLPKALIICENLVNVLAMPDTAGVIAAHGGGYSAPELARIPWVADVPVLYWGDLDSHGFAILNRLRHHIPHAKSILMDEATLSRYADLCVFEPEPNVGTFDHLAPAEQTALAALHAPNGMRRLEQERIEWEYAMNAFNAALDAL